MRDMFKRGVASCWRAALGLGLGLSLGLGLPAAQGSAQAASKSATKTTPKNAAKSSAKAAKAPAKAAAAPKPARAAGKAPAASKAVAQAGKASKAGAAAKGKGAVAKGPAGRSAPVAKARPGGQKDARAARLAQAGGKTAGRAGKQAATAKLAKAAARIPAGRAVSRLAFAPAPRLSMGQLAGLRDVQDPLELKSSVALVLDQDSGEVLMSKNDHAVLPIASITKLMTALVVSEAGLPLGEAITITEDDVDTARGSSSRLSVGTTLTRAELLHLTLMSSENRAAHALGRSFPGGMSRFVGLMNQKAAALGMKDTRYVEPTGLSSANRSSAFDLAALVKVAARDPLLGRLSTSPGYEVDMGDRVVHFGNTNRLVHSPDWQIGLQKTGYIADAGRCLVMQARVAGRNLIMVLLDAGDKRSRLADAERLRRWVETERAAPALWGQGQRLPALH